MKESFTAKTLEEAKQMASEKFGVSVDYIVFRILEKPKKGFLGLGKKEEYVVEAAYAMETPAAAPAPAAPAEPVPAEKPAAPAAAPETAPAQPEAKTEEAAPAEATAAEAITSVDEIVIPQDDSATRGVESAAIETILTDEEMSENLLRARQYIADIYHAMGIDIAITTMRTENGIRMELRSQTKSGTIIGRRGETLDSIQYLASILVNRDGEEYCRLLLDSNGYREKRRKTLEQLADKIARSVLRSGRSTTLEPMNPYERRIIHSRISEIEGVTSHSVGEDPYRKVVVAAVGGKRSSGRGRSGGQHGRGGKRPYRTERKPEDFKRSDMDSMKTSFERDYKKPKPEDELNAGLYGKIEF
ncbi:predicted RNA-binding protein [Ruminococcus sp. CAG:330]|nr:RNA-binding cell elongation regulator Jag/EloR [Ruminococcus sp. CAG:330]CDE11935.1 predicted RNA-binding protein [Ruminococcus sp. CAG:330]